MANATLRELREVESTDGPTSSVEPLRPRCPGCGAGVDPLRAGHVAILEGRFAYFCEPECKRAYSRAQGRQPEDGIETARPPAVASHGAAAGPSAWPAAIVALPSRASLTDPSLTPLSSVPVALRTEPPPDRHARPAWPPPAPRAPESAAPRPAADGEIESFDPYESTQQEESSESDEPMEPAATVPSSVALRSVAQPSLSRLASSPRAFAASSAASSAAAPALPRKASSSLLGPSRALGRVVAGLDALGIVSGALVPALGLLGAPAVPARVPLSVLSLAALVVRMALVRRDRSDPHAAVVLGPAVGAVGCAAYAFAVEDPHAASLAVFAGLACAAAIVVEVLVGRARVRVASARAHIEGALDVRVRAVIGDDQVQRPASEVRPGERVVVEEGETVGVDATVTAGEARVVPWLGAPIEIVRREGDVILAGARVVSSRLGMITTWSGRDRAWVKLLASPATRIDVSAPTPRIMRHTVERGAPVAGLLVGVAAIAANSTPVEVVGAMCAGALAFAAKAACSMVALHFARAHLDALASGIIYRDARAFERAASTRVAVLSARGTVLMGEPEIVSIEPVGGSDEERVLSLAAGAETVSAHPFAAAVLRAARLRGVRPDPVRNGAVLDGLGVTAVASSGERLVVGGRAIMLKQKIGVAITDTRVSELEGQGRSVLLVALGDRLVGILALQDGLRAGARAAVQRLLDARIEPVLLSGEARETCETIGRALDIEHVRPEVLPGDRGAEVRALAEGGEGVAVIGHPAGDDGALAAADVAVAMGASGSTPGEWAVVLASDDVRDAARALSIPHVARDRARLAMALGAAPGIVALLAIGFGVAPLAVAPIAALVGAAAVAAHARESVRGG